MADAILWRVCPASLLRNFGFNRAAPSSTHVCISFPGGFQHVWVLLVAHLVGVSHGGKAISFRLIRHCLAVNRRLIDSSALVFNIKSMQFLEWHSEYCDMVCSMTAGFRLVLFWSFFSVLFILSAYFYAKQQLRDYELQRSKRSRRRHGTNSNSLETSLATT